MASASSPAPARNTAILLLTCPDRKGVAASIYEFVYQHGANIIHGDEHHDRDNNLYIQRMEWELKDFDLDERAFARLFQPIAERFSIQWSMSLSNHRPRVAIMVSKLDHCMADLLYRRQIGELRCEFPLIISNHPDAKRLADFYEVPFHVVPVTTANREQAEREQLELLRKNNVELIVLARYMQILSSDFINQYPLRIINIHHSFLPAFIGAKPYHRSYERGVKLVGATSHYVTEILDEGPIIEQDVIRISHRDTLDSLIEKGRDLEKVVLSRAVRWHCESRLVYYGNKIAVFS